MKKAFLVFALFCGVFMTGFSQNEAISRQSTYIRFGYLNPFGDFGEAYTKGVSVEMGRLFSLNLPLMEELGGGIDWTFGELGFQTMREKRFITDSTLGGIFFTVGTKIGAALSYNPTDLLVFDVYLKYYPAFALSRKSMLDLAPGSLQEKQVGWAGSFVNSVSTGINLRYTYFSVGFEFCFGGANINYSENVVPVVKQEAGGPRIVSHIAKDENFSLASFRLNVGFWF